MDTLLWDIRVAIFNHQSSPRILGWQLAFLCCLSSAAIHNTVWGNIRRPNTVDISLCGKVLSVHGHQNTLLLQLNQCLYFHNSILLHYVINRIALLGGAPSLDMLMTTHCMPLLCQKFHSSGWMSQRNTLPQYQFRPLTWGQFALMGWGYVMFWKPYNIL